MSHSTVREQGAPLPANVRVISARKELAHIGDLIEAAKAQQESYHYDAKKHETLKNGIEELVMQHRQISLAISESEKKRKGSEEAAAAAAAKHADTERSHTTLLSAHAELKESHQQLKVGVATLKGEQDDLKKSGRNAADAALADVHAKIADAKKEHASILASNATASREAAAHSKRKKDHVELIEKVEVAQGALASAEKKTVDEEAKAKRVATDRASIEAEIADKRAKIEADQKEADATHATRMSALEKRDGDLSDRESWLSEKEAKLKLAKTELEKFYGRKISHINL